MRALYEKIPLRPGEPFCYRHFRLPRFQMPWHFHPEWELTTITRGRGMRYVGDSIERFDDGDLVLLGPNLPHYWWTDAGDRHGAHSVVIQFENDAPAGRLFELFQASEIQGLLALAGRGVKFSGAVVKRTSELLEKMGKLSEWRRLGLLIEVFGLLAEHLPQGRALASASYAPVLDERDGRRLRAVCKYVNDSYAESIEQIRAAALAGLSPAAFSRYFHKRMGKTFEAYVIEIRIGHACRRMQDEDATIAEIAFATGFNNLSNFNRHFRALKGMTPRDFRGSLRQ